MDHCAFGLQSGNCLGKVSSVQKVARSTLYTASRCGGQGEGEEERAEVSQVTRVTRDLLIMIQLPNHGGLAEPESARFPLLFFVQLLRNCSLATSDT